MARSDCFRLTEYAKTDLLSELNLTVNAKSDCDLIKWDSFPEKKLVYNVSEKSRLWNFHPYFRQNVSVKCSPVCGM